MGTVSRANRAVVGGTGGEGYHAIGGASQPEQVSNSDIVAPARDQGVVTGALDSRE
jgi:hypothetical protein